MGSRAAWRFVFQLCLRLLCVVLGLPHQVAAGRRLGLSPDYPSDPSGKPPQIATTPEGGAPRLNASRTLAHRVDNQSIDALVSDKTTTLRELTLGTSRRVF